MRQNLIYLILPSATLIICVYILYLRLNEMMLVKKGQAAQAVIESIRYTVFFGNRKYLGANPKKPGKERKFGCDYVLNLRFQTENGIEVCKEKCVTATIMRKDGNEYPYFAQGNTVPIRYLRRSPKNFAVVDKEVLSRQHSTIMAIVWGTSAVMLIAIIVTLIKSF